MNIGTRTHSKGLLVGLLALVTIGWGCKHPAPPPPPKTETPPPARPTVTLTASSTSLNKGDSATLTWSSTNATQLNLSPGVGTVAPEGSTKVTPDSSTTYTITATGPGGSADTSVSITVTTPPPPPPPPKAPEPTIAELFDQNVHDIYFDFNKADLRTESTQALTHTGDFLKSHPEVKVTIEGNCDERGSTEYNIALGDRRAQAARQFLSSLGVSADRLTTVSYGKEHPVCTESNEDCWQRNRHDHFVMAH